MQKKFAVGIAWVVVALAALWLGDKIVFGGFRVEACADCLLPELELSTSFCERQEDQDSRNVTTVRQALRWRGAYCRNGTIYDWRGREIRFHRMCEGYGARVTPEMEEQMRKRIEADRKEVEVLESNYTVIRMYGPQRPC
jgi:hypothetical protein